ncbi:DUF4249 domain-containing protein [Tunicatimonas pelagia]|uniref:DUF4249 domain-containing protein n=1 Tax=Tunicatimonas pelagia TaxID=931531 RepID=UPI002665EB63|nr:DUF4249 domain-containing protein [Tunicatimonas pelagia]WKN43148.1 DUF4249 domain-containing protein [Tunicatimonas pelagia]
MTRLKIYYLAGLATFILLSACEDVIEIDAPVTDARLVVEGWVYDDRDTQTILLSRSSPYFNSETPPSETGAQVAVTTQTGETFSYTETEAGVYLSSFQGTIGGQYTLTIETSEGQQYQSSTQSLQSVPPIDSLYVLFEDEDEDEDEGFYPAWDFTDPEGEENYYRWRFFINDSLQNMAEDILVFSDEFTDGEEINGVEFVLERLLQEGDRLRIEQLSITEESQDFLNRIQQLTTGVGGLFDTPPDPVRGNISNTTDEQNYALGFFGASSVAKDSLVVGE